MSDHIPPSAIQNDQMDVPALTDAAAVEVRGVDKHFETTSGIVNALEAINLTIADDEFVSLIGPSGCGKSTLMRLIADLDTPSAGELTVFGKTATQARLDQDYGIAFQQAGLLPWRAVAANVALPLELHGVASAARRSRVAELLDMVGLTDCLALEVRFSTSELKALSERNKIEANGAVKAPTWVSNFVSSRPTSSASAANSVGTFGESSAMNGGTAAL
jgi:ABC-type glutathione transport system ATPase component